MDRRRAWSRAAGVALAMIAAMVMAVSTGGTAHADGAWLDGREIANWNVPSAAIPAAPALDPATDMRCLTTVRPPETDEDYELAAEGWLLIGAYQGGYGVKVITAASGFDGMCRPTGFNQFVFYHQRLIGTVSPELMSSRTDGVLQQSTLSPPFGGGLPALTSRYSRYSATDPLCCPSRVTELSFTIVRTPGGFVLTPGTASTQPVSGS